VLHSPQNLGTDFDERVLPSIGNEVLKSVVAQYNAAELLTLRDQVSLKVRTYAFSVSGGCSAVRFGCVPADISILFFFYGSRSDIPYPLLR